MYNIRGLLRLSMLLALVAIPLGTANRHPGAEITVNEPQGSLRGALRALERRRRASSGTYSLASFQDREDPQDIIEYLGSRGDYQIDDSPLLLDQERSPVKSYPLTYLDKEDYPEDDYVDLNYKKTAFRERNDQIKEHLKTANAKKNTSAFREREAKHNSQSNKLENLFLKELAEKEEQEREESDAEYAELLRQLWEKYRYTHPDAYINDPQVDLQGMYKERSIRKRQIPGDYTPTGGWGPIAFKRKRSSKQRIDNNDNPDFLYSLKFVSQGDPSTVENLKDDKVVDEEEDPDISKIINNREPEPRYSAFDMPISQPLELDDDPKLMLQPLSYPPSDEMYLPDGSEIIESPIGSENLYPITKRSSSSLNQRFAKRNLPNTKTKQFRSAVTDPKIMKDLSSIFGTSGADSPGDETILKPVKRSNVPEDDSHESKSPTISAVSHHQSNESHESAHNDHDHEHEHPHSRHEHENKPPLLSSSNNGFDHSHEGEEKEVQFDDTEDTHIKLEHPIILKKKSIDWSKYFGIDKRKKKSINTFMDFNDLKDPYTSKAKRFMRSFSHQDQSKNNFEEKREPKQVDRLNKLENMDNKLKNMETAIIDEALEYGDGSDGFDTKEEQEMKEKILSRLVAAYSLEKMRKALNTFKMNLQTQKNAMKDNTQAEVVDDKEKRMSTKTKAIAESDTPKQELDIEDIKAIEDGYFENEQGAGHFLNGPAEIMSEGYMGGNSVSNKPFQIDSNEVGNCPILDRIVRRCHNVDILAGDHGQVFLPLCSLHQICYLCGPSSPTGCDLMFLSEADSACGGRSACQRAARGALMALRDLHTPLAHHLQGECSRDSCLSRPLRDNKPWHQPFLR